MFDPKTNRYPYPEDTGRHYLEVHMDRGIVFDQYYPYVDQSKGMRFKRALIRVLLNIVVFPLTTVRLGLRIEERGNLRKHREELRKGVISCSNHVHMWDYLCVMKGVRPFKTGILSWAPNINGENGTLIRLVGGYPEGVCYSLLLMNAVTPLIDRFCKPRIFGAGGANNG